MNSVTLKLNISFETPLNTLQYFFSTHTDAPTIHPESSCYLRGDFLKCVCKAEAFPDASIHWSIDGNDSLPSSLSFVSSSFKHVVSGELSGRAESQANVTCTATNFLGKHSKQLYLNNTSMSGKLNFSQKHRLHCILTTHFYYSLNISFVSVNT